MSHDDRVNRPTLRERWRSLGRARKAALISPAALLGLVGAAAAAMLFVAPITGSTTVQGASLAWYDSGSSTANTTYTASSGASCSGNVSGGKLALTFSGLPGDTCTVNGFVKNTGTMDVKAQSVAFSSKVNATLGSFCGTSVPASSTSFTPLTVKFTIPADAAIGTSIPADADAGLKAVRSSDYVAADCS